MSTVEELQYMTGLLGGLEKGVGAYQSAQQAAMQRKNQELQTKLSLTKEGYEQTPEGDLVESAASPEELKMARGLIKQSNPKATDEDIEALVPEGTKRRHLTEGGLLKTGITGGYGTQNRLLTSQRIGESNDIKREALGERKSQNAAAAGQAFEHDPILKTSKTSLNSLNRSSSILDNPNKPVTTKDLNLAYQDYINAVAAGGTATEGKIQRELPETWEQEWNALKSKAGEFDDLRNTPTGKKLINMLHENIRTVKSDLGNAITEQAGNLGESYKYSTNPLLQKTVQGKINKYSLPSQEKQPGLIAVPQGPQIEDIGGKKYMKLPDGRYQEVE